MSKRSSLTWTAAVTASREAGRSAQNPVLYQSAPGEPLILLHTSQQAGPLGAMQRTSKVMRVEAIDSDARQWRAPTLLFAEGAGAFLRHHVVARRDASGRRELLLPMYFTPGGEFEPEQQYSSLRRQRLSDDQQTMHLSAFDDEFRITGTDGAMGVQPSLIVDPRDPNHILVFMRSRVPLPKGWFVSI
jgi:hypothetical protein